MSIFSYCLRLAAYVFLLAACPQLNAAELGEFYSDGDWITPDVWPYKLDLDQNRKSSILLLIDQGGVDIKITSSDGAVSSSPPSRIGPEFILVHPEDSNSFLLEPVFNDVAPGKIRIRQMLVQSPRLRELGQSLKMAGLSAGASYQESMLAACDIYKTIANDNSLGTRWNAIGTIYLSQCQLATGNKISESLISQMRRIAFDDLRQDFPFQSYQIDWLIARNSFWLQEYESAEIEFGRALAKAQKAGANFPEVESAIQLDIAEMFNQYGDNGMMLSWKLSGERSQSLLEEAEQRIRTSIRMATASADSLILGNAYHDLAGVLFIRGESKETIKYMELAEGYLAAAGDSGSQAQVLGNIGDYYRRWGQLKKSQNAYHKAISLYSSTSDLGNHGHLYSKLSSLNLMFSDFKLAIQNAYKAIEYYQAAGQIQRQNEELSHLATIFREQGDYLSARSTRQQALNYFDNNGWLANSLSTQSELSHDERLLGNIELAYELSKRVVKQLENSAINAGLNKIPVFINHAELLFEIGEQEAAIELVSNTLTEASNEGAEPLDEIALLTALTDMYQRLGQTENAIRIADKSFGLIESQRTQFDSVRLGPRWSARTNVIYGSHLEYLLRLDNEDYIERAFRIAERASAISFRHRRQEMMLDNNQSNDEANSQWLKIVSELQTSKGEIASDQERLQFERRFNEAQERYFAAHGLSAEMKPLEIMSSEKIGELIPVDSMVLQYFSGADSVWRFDLSNGHFTVTEIGDNESLSKLIELTLQNVQDSQFKNRNILAQLSDMLLKGLELDSNTTHLLISTTSQLGTVPFSSLFYQQSYLTQSAALTMVPSISEYFSALPGTASPADGRLEIAVLADPTFESSSPGPDQLETGEVFRSWSSARQRLPYSAKEAKDLSQYFRHDERLILTGDEATESNFFNSRVREAKIIHVATHGYFNEELPELVGLAVAKSNLADDGFISLAEISAQRFSAELVVISACDTARGLNMPGEGALSLSRSFLAQGVDSVVSTLWPISDAATAIFMKEFYRSMKDEKLGPAVSLQNAQRALRQNPRYRSASYWGAYVITSAVPGYHST